MTSLLVQHIHNYAAKNLTWDDLLLCAQDQERKRWKDEGVVYTPSWIVDRILDHVNPTITDTVWDNSVGHGGFVIPLLERLLRHHTVQTLHAWLLTHTRFTDISEDAVSDLRQILSAFFQRNGLSTRPESFTNVFTDNGLNPPPHRFDVAIGNPPYVRIQNLDTQTATRLRQEFATCKTGNVDLCHAFIENAFTHADRVGLITPNAFLTTRSGKTLRTFLADKIEHIHDFGTRKVFPGASAYTCLVLGQHNPPKPGIVTHETKPARPFADLLSTTKPPHQRDVRAGIATLCDRVFLVIKTPQGFFSPLDEHHTNPIEPEIVRPLLKITKLRADSLTKGQHGFILFPYDENQRVLEEDVLKTRFPNAHKHLQTQRTLLESRDKGKTQDYPTWYAYGRSQGLKGTGNGTILAVPSMIGGAAWPLTIDVSELAQKHGTPLFTSGFVVVNPTTSDEAALLSQRFLDEVKRVGTAKPGKNGDHHNIRSELVKTFV